MKYLLINIHGFLSSHESDKVIEFRKKLTTNHGEVEFLSPRLPDTPEAAVRLIEELIHESSSSHKAIGLVGHSLGGYFATYIASKYGLRAVLVNPVVRGYDIMCEFFGDCYNPHTDEKFEITAKDIEYLAEINLEIIPDKSLFFIMQQLGDEIVDPQEALSYYSGCRSIIEQGGCHDFSGFATHSQTIVNFLFPSETWQFNQTEK